MTSLACVAVLAFASFLLQCQCVNGRPSFVYMVCFPRKEYYKQEQPATGFIQMGSGVRETGVVLTTVRVQYELTMQPCTYERLTTEALGMNYIEGLSRLTLSISATSDIMVTCGTSAYPYFDDAFTVYPISTLDRSFYFAFSQFVTFAVLLSASDYTEVTIDFFPPGTKKGRVSEIKFNIYRFVAYYWPNTYFLERGSVSHIISKRGIAVYTGYYGIQASLRPSISFGTDFMIYGVSSRLTYDVNVVSVKAKEPIGVRLEDETRKRTSYQVPANQAFPGYREIKNLAFKLLTVRATDLISLTLVFLSAKKVSSDYPSVTPMFVPCPSELLDKMTSYGLSIPYELPEWQTGTRMITLISKYPESYKLYINGDRLDRWPTKDSFTVSGVNHDVVYHAVSIVHNQTMTIWTPQRHAGYVRFAIYLYHLSEAGVYFMEARGLDNSIRQKNYSPDYGTRAGTRHGSSKGAGWTQNQQLPGPEWMPNTFTYVIASIPTSVVNGRSFTGGLTVSCYSDKWACSLLVTESSHVNRRLRKFTISVRAHEIHTREFVLFDENKVRIFTTVASSRSIGVIVMITDGGKAWETFSLYPMLQYDNFFVMAVPKETKYILIVPRKDDTTQVRISEFQSHDEPYQFKSTVETLNINTGYIWQSTKIKGSLIRSQKPVAVYYGIESLKGQVPSFKRYGRDFVIYRSDPLEGWATVYAPACAFVSWIDSSSNKMQRRRVACARYCTSPKTLELKKRWDYMRLMSTSDVAVVMRHESSVPSDSLLSSTFIKPLEQYSHEYVVRPPFKGKGSAPDPQLLFISNRQDLASITVGSVSVRTFLMKAKLGYDIPLGAFKKKVRIWADIALKREDTLHFKSTGNPPVKFGIVLYYHFRSTARNKGHHLSNHFTKGHYATFVQGLIKHKPRNDEWRYGMQLGKLDKCDTFYDSQKAMLRQTLERENDGLARYVSRTLVVISFVASMVALLVGATAYSIWKTVTEL